MIDVRKVLKIYEICNFQHYISIYSSNKNYIYFNLLPTRNNESNFFVII